MRYPGSLARGQTSPPFVKLPNMLVRTFVAVLLPVQALGLVVPRDDHQWQAPGPNDRALIASALH